MVVVMMMHHGSGRRRGRGGRSVCLREGIAAKADRENGGGGESLDHGMFLFV
jgi:hypothetical protein